MHPFRTRQVTANDLTFTVDEQGEGDTVALMLHGFPQSRVAWRRLMPHLASLGWRMVAPDMRGYGDSDRPARRSDYAIERLVDDVAALFEAVGARRRILIGHDWGGVVAWQAALGGVPLDGLVILNAPHPAVFEQRVKQGWRQRLRSSYVMFFQLPYLPERQLTHDNGQALVELFKRQSSAFSAEELEIYRANIVQPGAATAMLNYYRTNLTTLARDPRAQTRLDVPTLMVWGEKDPFLDLSLTEGNEAFVQDFTLRRLPGVSHWVIEEAAADAADRISRWAAMKDL